MVYLCMNEIFFTRKALHNFEKKKLHRIYILDKKK